MGQATPRAKPQRLAALTRLRALLIGWVVIYHLELAVHAFDTMPLAESVVMKGYLGVDGFFILSGFALFLGYRHRPPLGIAGWADFVARRAARIFPLHLLALAALVGLVGVATLAGARINDPQRFGAWELLMQAPLLHGWETTDVFAWNYPSWALSAIWAGYLAFPLVLPAVLARGAAGAGLLAAASLAGLAWLGHVDPVLGLNWTLHLGLVRFALEFTLGMALARLVTWRALEAGLMTASAVLLVPGGLWLGLDAMVVAGLAALVARLGMEAPGAAPPRDLLWRLGEASFGVYLCWIFIEGALVLAVRWLEPGTGMRLALFGGGLVATLAAGWLAWRFVEVPAAKLLAGVGQRAPGKALAPR
jgi:peptidoglycan/LPS O-acetylase OafA/YrhL